METRELTVRQFFGRGGVLAKCQPGYEFRSGQLEMAEAVESALADKRHLIVEAGTGTGKTLAYLVPAILSGKRIVISTATKNLQEQLLFKDIPFLQQHLGREIRVCSMKGRNNYACRQKIYDAEKEPVLEGLEEVADFEIIREWEKTTVIGDRAEIKTLPETTGVWAKVDARRDLCSGQKCLQFERCFLTLMHQRAFESDIIVVNHHLLFADLAVKDQEYGGIIPDYAAAILDEAHEIEDVAGQYFGVSISSYQFQELQRDIAAVARRKEFGTQELERQHFLHQGVLDAKHRAQPAFADAAQNAIALADDSVDERIVRSFPKLEKLRRCHLGVGHATGAQTTTASTACARVGALEKTAYFLPSTERL